MLAMMFIHVFVTLECMILFMNMLLGTPKHMRLSDLYLGILVLELRDRP